MAIIKRATRPALDELDAFDEEDIPFVIAYDLENTGVLSNEKAALIGAALITLLPPLDEATPWFYGARFDSLSKRVIHRG